jgi:hypothetical protein
VHDTTGCCHPPASSAGSASPGLQKPTQCPLKYCHLLHCERRAGSATASKKQQLVALAPSDHCPNTEQIAAAAQYHKEAVTGFRQRAAVPAVKYVIPPEPLDMRAQHKKVRSRAVTCKQLLVLQINWRQQLLQSTRRRTCSNQEPHICCCTV